MDFIENKLLLLTNALNELEQSITDTQTDPKSISLLCLSLNIDFDVVGKLIFEFINILNTNDNLTDLENKEILNIFRNAILKHTENIENSNDIVIYKIIRSMANCYIPELLPISKVLKESMNIYFS